MEYAEPVMTPLSGIINLTANTQVFADTGEIRDSPTVIDSTQHEYQQHQLPISLVERQSDTLIFKCCVNPLIHWNGNLLVL